MTPRERTVVLVVMCLGYFLVLLDVTIVNVALPSIRTSLRADVSGLQWVVDGYALALSAFLLAAGTTGDRLGHKRVVLSGLVVFGLASLACGLAPTTGVLVAARVVQGLGAAVLLPGTLAIIGTTFPERGEQARAIGVWAAIGSAALPAGPLLGGVLVQGVGWRWVFLLNVPIVAVAAMLTSRVVQESREHEPRRLDVGGLLTGAVALAALTGGVIEAGHGSGPVVVVVLLLVAVAAGVAFVAVERRSTDPMVPLGLFRRPAFVVANASAGLMNLGTLGLLFLMTQYLQDVQGRSPSAAGVALLPLFLPLSLLTPYVGRVIARRGPRLPAVAGLVVAAIGVGALGTLTPGTTYLVLLPMLLLWGVGIAVLTPSVVAGALASVEGARTGLASGINNTARQAGGALGIALFGAVAGSPDRAGAFVAGLGACGLATAAVWLVTAIACRRMLPAESS